MSARGQIDLFATAASAPPPAAAPMLRVLWVMLNPSTADGRVDDPTIRKCMGFTSRWAGGPGSISTSVRSARVSPCGRYRYTLERSWTASAPRWSFTVVNLFAWRSTDPAAMVRAARDGADVVGPDNRGVILAEAAGADRIVVAWGARVSFGPRAPAVIREARRGIADLLRGREVLCLGTAGGGEPRHPLMLAWATPLEPYRLEAA